MLQLQEPQENSSSNVDNHKDVNSDDTVLDHPLQTTSDGGQFPSSTWQSVPTISSALDISTANLAIDPSSPSISLDISTANLATSPSSPSISVPTNLSTASALPGISTTTNLAIGDSSAEISATSNLEMLTSLAAQLANASNDNFVTSQGLQFEEVDFARYSSEPVYFQPDVKPNSHEEILYSLQLVPYKDVDMVDGAETGQALKIDNVKLETFSNEDVEMDQVGVARRGIKQENVEPERYSNEDVEITDTKDKKMTIQGGKIQKKRGPQKYNKRSDQPAKFPPLPLESELFDDPEPEIGSRKEKSLALLAQKMLEMFPMQGMDLTQAIQLDQVAKYLGTEIGRLGVIVDVFEALHIMSKLGKNLYNWHGCSFLIPTLVWLRQISDEMGVREQYEFVKNKELEAILINARKKNNFEEVLPDDRQGASSEPSSEPPEEIARMSPKYNSKYCGSTSVGINTQLFLMLMLVSPEPKTVNLEFAASVMHGSSNTKKRNHIRRFLDVSNVLSCLGLVLKVRTATGQGSRNAYQYNGPHLLDDMEVPEVVKMAMPVSRQKNSVFPYPKSTENNDKNVEIKKRGRNFGSKNKVKENNCGTIGEDGNEELIVQDVDGMKKRGRKSGQKNAKKVKTAKDVVNEIVETLINEILEIPENIVKKKRGRKPGLRKGCTRVETEVDYNETNIGAKDKKRDLSDIIEVEQVDDNNKGNTNKENNFKILKPKKDEKVRIDRDIDEKKSIEVDTKKLRKRNLSENVEIIQKGPDNEDVVKSHKRKLSMKMDIVQIDADEGEGTKIRLDKGGEHGEKSRKRKHSKKIESAQIGADEEDGFMIGSDLCGKAGVKRRKRRLSKKMEIVQIGTDEDDGIKSIQSKSSQKREKKDLGKDINDNANLVEHGIRRSRRLLVWNKGKDDLTDKVSNDQKKIVKLRNKGKDVNEESNGLKIKYDLTDANCFDLRCSEGTSGGSKNKLLNLALVCQIEKEKMEKGMSII